MKIPVIVISGFLGAGKTTFLRRLISSVKKKLAIIMNEFGEVAIDAEVIKGKAVNMIELTGGCVCCSLTGELEYAINEIIEKVKPEYILIETTGIAEPDSLIYNLENIPSVVLDNVITIVDCDGIARFPEIGYTQRVQIESADFILLNKIDLVNEEQLKEVENKVRSINERALIYKTKFCNGNLDYNLFFGYFIDKESVKLNPSEHTEEFESLYFDFEGKVNREEFEKFISNLPRDIYRAKGNVIFKDGKYIFNYVAGRLSYDEFNYNKNRFLFVGKNIKKFENNLKNSIKKILQNE